jgi:hypothetical protein
MDRELSAVIGACVRTRVIANTLWEANGMSKIIAYQQAKRIAANVKDNLTKARGMDSSNNDKHRLYVQFSGKLNHNNWKSAELQLHAAYGYYGSSSGYSAMDAHTAEYMAKAINAHMNAIAETAIKYAEADAETARKAAEDEARLVLTEVSV